MAKRKRKTATVGGTNGVVAADPLAFLAEDHNKVLRVRAALRRLDSGKANGAGGLRAFLRAVRKAVETPQEQPESMGTQE